MNYINKFLYYFGNNKKSFPLYIILSLITGCLELCGVALIYPLILSIVSDSVDNKKWYIILLATAIICLFLLKNLLMIIYVYFQTKLVKKIELEIMLKYMKYFVYSDYKQTSQISLHEKTQIINFLIPNTVNNCIFRIFNLIVNIVVFLMISAFLVVKFTLPSIIAIISAIFVIYIQYKVFKPILKKLSNKLRDLSLAVNKHSNSILLNLKGIKISNNETFFYKNYSNYSIMAYNENAKSAFINFIPPYIIEPFIIIILFVLIAIISFQSYCEPAKLLASYALIASAMFRMAPIISRIQVNINGICTAYPYFKELIETSEKLNILNINESIQDNITKINSNIEFKNVSFEYEKNKTVLKDINLFINKGDFIGITGLSGTGKTTLVDLMIGLFKPTEGQILIDGKIFDKRLNVGYIPQEYYVLNASIRENVAFGIEPIDDEKVIKSLKIAQLYDFITNNYADGIYANPFVDNTGFSQGQKQRLMIARALYTEPDILILDEATSSLDLKTEEEICNVLNELKREITIIAIAHRISTIKSTDKIIYMQNGTIKQIDTFNNLYKSNDEFKYLVDLSSLKI